MPLRFANAEKTDVSLDRDGLNYIGPWPGDGEWGRWIAEAGGKPAPFVEPAALVPQTCARHQGLLALLGVGITEAMILDEIEKIADPVLRETTRIRFTSPNWNRQSGFVVDFGKKAFKLTDTQLDQLFIAAQTL